MTVTVADRADTQTIIKPMTVLAEYLFKLGGSSGTDWKQKGVAVASYTVAVLCEYKHVFFRYQPLLLMCD